MGVAVRGFGLSKAKQTKVSISNNEGLRWRMPKTSFGNPLISEFIYETPKKILCTAKTISSQNDLFRFFQPVIAKMFLSRSFKRPEAEYKCVARLYNHDKWLNLRKRGEGSWGRGVLHLISLDVLPVKMRLKRIPRKEYFCQQTRLSEEYANGVHCHHDGPFLH